MAIAIGLVCVFSLLEKSHELDQQLERFMAATGEASSDKASDIQSNQTIDVAAPNSSNQGVGNIQQAENEIGEISKADLAAQKSMADSAKWMLLTAVVQTVLAIGGTICLLHSLHLTRRAVNVAEQTRIDSIKQSKRALRAYVHIKAVKVSDFEVGRSPKVTIVVINRGQTPAYRQTCFGSPYVFREYDKYCTIANDDNTNDTRSQETVGPGDERTVTVDDEAFILSQDRMDKINAGTHALFITGEIEYMDAFDTLRVTRYCGFLGGEKKGSIAFHIHTSGNEAT